MDRYTVKVIPNAKKNNIQEGDGGRMKIHVTAPPADGKANKAVIEVLADHLGVRKSRLRIVQGEKSKEKVVAVEDGG